MILSVETTMTNSPLGNGTTAHLNFTTELENGSAGPRKSLDQMRHARNIYGC
jgi:hypothetical protein